MYKDGLMDIWERTRDTLRKLRGENKFRGTEIHLIPKREIRLPLENRKGNIQRQEIVIHLSDAEIEVWAELRPGGTQFYLKHFDMDLEGFVGKMVELARGGEYLKTNPDKGDYRDPFDPIIP